LQLADSWEARDGDEKSDSPFARSDLPDESDAPFALLLGSLVADATFDNRRFIERYTNEYYCLLYC
jgi:hypothetical protein